jgi:hypothetical protein
MTDGRNVTMKRRLTHQGEWVRAVKSVVRAIVAIHVPRPDPSVAMKSGRKDPERRRSAS